jgi:serine-type D-Ala-D-Ala carboxypeptidase (penicillin-binding protein 5/6)
VTRLVLALTLSLVSAFASPFAVAQNLSLPPFTAKSWLVTDVTANHIIAASNPNERVEPASLTKLMTAYIVFSALRDKKIERAQVAPVSQRAWKTGGSKMFIEPLKKVAVDELMHGMIVQSGNDASIALAELIAGSEEAFAGMMNAEAKRLGDIALLAGAIIREHPELYGLYAIKEYRYNNITQPNRNRLLWLDPNVDGMKTGHTQSAGFCLVASAKRADRRLLSVIMGAPSDSVRAQESQTLLNFGFQSFDTVRLYEKSKPIASLKLWKGEAKELKAGVAADLYVAIPRGTNDKIKAELTSQQPLLAPIAKGQRIGTVKVAYDGKPVAEYPVLAMEEVAVAGFFGRSWDSVLLWFK